MEYKYLPNTFNFQSILLRFGTIERFTELQIKYKQQFEHLLFPILKIDELQAIIQSASTTIPVIDDAAANFYRAHSMLQNPYIYVRNNYHIEALTDEELETLNSQNDISPEFFKSTFDRVLFEEGDIIFYGTPRDETMCRAKCIAFEFAYDQVKCESVEQLVKIEKVIARCKEALERNMQSANIPVSLMIYNGIPKRFKDPSYII